MYAAQRHEPRGFAKLNICYCSSVGPLHSQLYTVQKRLRMWRSLYDARSSATAEGLHDVLC